MMDIISTLPDEILCHILSFLLTQQAAATCVLSMRWKHLWISVPALNYTDEIYVRNNKPSSCFDSLVCSSIQARDVKQHIRSFRLKYSAYFSNSHFFFNNCILPAIQQHVIENIDIDFASACSFFYTFTIISSTTLVVLKLSNFRFDVHFSSSVELPSLKCLHLVDVGLRNPHCLWELLCRCPILEDLKAIAISYADHDASFSVEGFKSFSKLVRADVGSYRRDYIPLKAISNVEFLSLNKFQAGNDVVPQFPNLIHLVLTFQDCMPMNWHLVLEMLRNCPKLQVFELISKGGHDDIFPNTHLVPECLTSSLRKCSLGLYFGTENDQRFAKYIMQNSTTLRTMTICEGRFTSIKHKILEELSLCPRGSPFCQLLLGGL